MDEDMRILIADADRPFLEIEREYLRKCGYEVLIASDGPECSTILQEFTPDVFVLDCELIWAQSVAEAMQKQRGDKPIPAILISDSNPEESPLISLRLPFAGWFRKPFAMGDLFQKLVTLGYIPKSAEMPS
jgi:CheY-like chemotaxis protein